ncbi:uncharacterized protein BDV14DRAFT_195767 [Aspergillus stella-maris]|uniref:uncharacterized protein n=1 Tax=Aspergillus stella-maris TaxID=1810926 RepID=UPI003CCDB8C0
MTYRSNYEPYTSRSLDLRPSDEILYPLGDLYPHVVALQLQPEDESPWSASKNYSGWQDTSYWAEIISSPRSLPEHYSKRSFRRCSESTKSKFVSRIRRLLSRDDLRRRRRFD